MQLRKAHDEQISIDLNDKQVGLNESMLYLWFNNFQTIAYVQVSFE